MAPFLLAVIAILFAGPAPRVMARFHGLRRHPRAALLLWQAVSLAAVIAALAAVPAALPLVIHDAEPSAIVVSLVIVAVAVSGGVLVTILASGHRVGRRLRELRLRHRTVIDLIGQDRGDGLRVVEHPLPSAYCVPGRRGRVVLSQGLIDALADRDLDAVVAHERAHLRQRHDLVVEFFTVLHEAVPPPLRCDQAMREVALLVETLADRQAARRVGTATMRSALNAVADGQGAGEVEVRRALLSRTPDPWLGLAFVSASVLVVALPVVVLVAAWR